MNTITDNRLSILNAIIFQRKSLLLLISMLLIGVASAQSIVKRVDITKEYKNELTNRLSPKVDTSTTKVVALFITKPSFTDPECSIRIIDKGNQSFIEARILEKNLWGEQYKQKKQADSLSVETLFYSAPVSCSFRDKMLSAFTKVIELHENRIKPNGIQLYDGICYEFMVSNNGITLFAKIDYDLRYDDFRNKVAATNLLILAALKKLSFNSSLYDLYR